MYKLTVFFALVAVAFAAPGFLHGGYGIPAATSYSSRVDIHKPILASYAAPIVKTVVAEPIITKTIVASPIHSYAAAPVYSSGLGLGHGYGGYGGYGGLGGGYGYGVGSLGYGHGLSYGLGYGHGW